MDRWIQIDDQCIHLPGEARGCGTLGYLPPSQLTPILTPNQAKHAVAVHWGTFPLTSEPLLEPPKRLRAAAAAAGLAEEEFAVMAHGEARCFPCQP